MVLTPSQKKQEEEQPPAESPQDKQTNPLEKQVADLQAQIKAMAEAKSESQRQIEEKEEERRLLEEQQQEQELREQADLVNTIFQSQPNAAEEERIVKRDIEDLSNKEIIDVMTNSIQKSLSARDKLAESIMDKKISKLVESIDGIKNVVGRMTANQAINATRAKHQDFDDYKEDIIKIWDKYPGMEPEDAYNLAKSHSAKKVPSKKQTETEKPTAPSKLQKTQRARQGHEEEIGLPAFRSIVEEGLERALDNMGVDYI